MRQSPQPLPPQALQMPPLPPQRPQPLPPQAPAHRHPAGAGAWPARAAAGVAAGAVAVPELLAEEALSAAEAAARPLAAAARGEALAADDGGGGDARRGLAARRHAGLAGGAGDPAALVRVPMTVAVAVAEPAAGAAREPARPAAVAHDPAAAGPAARIAAGAAGPAVMSEVSAVSAVSRPAGAQAAAGTPAVAAGLVAVVQQAADLALDRPDRRAEQAERLAAGPLADVMAVGDRRGVIGLPRVEVHRRGQVGDRPGEDVVGRRGGRRQAGRQGERRRGPSPVSEAHGHSLFVRRRFPPGVFGRDERAAVRARAILGAADVPPAFGLPSRAVPAPETSRRALASRVVIGSRAPDPRANPPEAREWPPRPRQRRGAEAAFRRDHRWHGRGPRGRSGVAGDGAQPPRAHERGEGAPASPPVDHRGGQVRGGLAVGAIRHHGVRLSRLALVLLLRHAAEARHVVEEVPHEVRAVLRGRGHQRG